MLLTESCQPPRRAPHTLVAAVLAVACLAPAPAHADSAPGAANDGRRTIGILAVEGPTPDGERVFESQLESQLDTGHVWLVNRARMRDRLRNSTRWTDGCVVGACLAEVKVQTGAELVVLAALHGEGTSYGYVVSVLRTDTGRLIAQESERCDVCTVSEVTSAATLAAVRLVTGVPDRLPDDAAERAAAVDIAMARAGRERAADLRGSRRLGWAMTVVGLLAAGVGTALYATADDPSDAALGTAAAGAGLAAGGVLVLVF